MVSGSLVRREGDGGGLLVGWVDFVAPGEDCDHGLSEDHAS